ncbi:hypothetical protein M378DRAFT_17743 [Amanita muscaria Koide BX008]|uniref:Uncharacterized protein n=1 Tax=Amanita muscaria (strain Koide BX008) TaxID=946122 RepID=A0A0C2WHR2_AMAMK|nr:hypothetical protein M378DRAFT_17743 [Amanita muscaria Koide BX008]
MDLVERNTDMRLPFRDRAASRRRILEEDGPFSGDHLLTREGFFSALIYRGVTYGTQFLQEEKTFYPDLQAWSSRYQLLRSIGHGETYFCKKDAYGTAAAARSPDNVQNYWDAAKIEELRPHPGKSFTEFFQTIKKSPRMPAFGSLTAYLLSADYAIAGGLQKPSVSELGGIIHGINKGGRKGLELLGYGCSSSKETAKAFSEVYGGLQAFFTGEERRNMDFGPIFLEHALCKLSRFKKISQFQDVCQEWDVPIV